MTRFGECFCHIGSGSKLDTAGPKGSPQKKCHGMIVVRLSLCNSSVQVFSAHVALCKFSLRVSLHKFSVQKKTCAQALAEPTLHFAAKFCVQFLYTGSRWCLWAHWPCASVQLSLRNSACLAVGQNQWYHFGVGEFTTHFRTYFSGDWDVHWGLVGF